MCRYVPDRLLNCVFMRVCTLQHSDFRLALRATTAQTERYLADFVQQLPPGLLRVADQAASWRLTLLTDTSATDAAEVPGPEWVKLQRAWTGLQTAWDAPWLQQLAGTAPDGVADFVYLIPQRHDAQTVRFYLTNYVFRLEKQWLMAQGGYLLHASSVVKSGRGYVFLGRSGAGKSTVAGLSRAVADGVLHDDRVFVREQDGKYLLLAAPTTSAAKPEIRDQLLEQSVTVPLHACFVLAQDTTDRLERLTERALARALLEGFLQSSATFVTEQQEFRRAMQLYAGIARRVPGYALYFRKSPDFWQVIEAELG